MRTPNWYMSRSLACLPILPGSYHTRSVLPSFTNGIHPSNHRHRLFLCPPPFPSLVRTKALQRYIIQHLEGDDNPHMLPVKKKKKAETMGQKKKISYTI